MDTFEQQLLLGTKLIFRALLMLLGIGLVYLLWDVVLLILLAIVFAAALNPLIDRLTRFRMPRPAAVIVSYAAVLVFFGFFISLVVPPFMQEVNSFLRNIPMYVTEVYRFFDFLQAYNLSVDSQDVIPQIRQSVAESASNIFSTTLGVVSGIISFIVFFFLSLYLSIEEDGIEKFFLSITPSKHHERSLRLAHQVQKKISQWMVGQFLVMLTVSLIYWIGLMFLGVPYALLLALLGGFMEIIPYAGPVMAAIPAVLIAFFTSPLLGVLTLVFYLVAHQLESHLITPQIMKRTVGLNPVVVILALLIGAKLGGILGVILAVPMATVASVFLEEFERKKNKGN